MISGAVFVPRDSTSQATSRILSKLPADREVFTLEGRRVQKLRAHSSLITAILLNFQLRLIEFDDFSCGNDSNIELHSILLVQADQII